MRVAIINSNRRKMGGIEAYLDAVIPALTSANVEVGFWHEIDQPESHEQIALDQQTPSWCVSEIGAEKALAELRRWSPEVIYAHGLVSPQLEAATLEIAPGVFFAHAYYGTCISGAKSWSNHTIKPCNRAFGLLCLAHYYPHRCGGLNPLTMLGEYRRQAARLELLQRYRCVLTSSEHMRAEFANHRLNAQHVPLLTPLNGGSPRKAASSSKWRLLFLGRMDRLKGGLHLIDALPRIREALGRPLHVTFAGDGPDRESWQQRATKMATSGQALSFDFPGWITGDAHDALFANADLLVMPSLWPEPFGLAGPQAGLYGIPAAAFAVGGISDWLKEGINGYLAPADPATAHGLADTVVKCLSDEASYQRLRQGAMKVAQSFTASNHVSTLLRLFRQAASS